MSERVRVRHPDLVTHASRVAAVADRVGGAARAGRAVQADPGAYGEWCAMVPSLLAVVQDVVVHGIDAAAGSLHDSGCRLRATASAYESADRRRAAVFDAIRGGR